MSTINTNFKADATSYDGSQYADNIAETMNRLEEAYRDIDQFIAENSPYLTEEQLTNLERLKVTMKAEMAAIEAYGQGGYSEAGAASDYSGTSWNLPTDLQAGWNILDNGTLRVTDESSDAALLSDEDAYGTYMGTVNFESGRIVFSVQDDNIEKVEVNSIGKDLALTVTYEDGSKETWVVKNGSVRPEDFAIDASRMNHGVTIDCSGALRISDGRHGAPYGNRYGFHIWGTNFDDHLIGSQGRDVIIGLADSDKIDGMAGNDILFGDEPYAMEGYASTPATDIDGYAAGDDDIRGGEGADTIYGGAGIDTGYESDDTSATNPDKLNDMGGDMQNDIATPPDPSTGWLDPDSNWSYETEDGTIVLSHVGSAGGEINISLPDGYNMAFADIDPDGSSLVITFVGYDTDGNPSTFKVKIEDFFNTSLGVDPSSSVVTLNIEGSDLSDIIDFSKITDLENQNINIYGNGGNDIILGVDSALVRDGIDVDNWWVSTASERDLNEYKDSDIFAHDIEDGEGWTSEVRDGQIVVTSDGTEHDEDCVVRVIAPDESYDHGYITVDGDGHTCVILVNDEGKTIVIKFEDENLDYNNIYILDRRPESDGDDSGTECRNVRLIPIDFAVSDNWYAIDGGDGSDVLFGIDGSNFNSEGEDSEDFIVEGEIPEEDL